MPSASTGATATRSSQVVVVSVDLTALDDARQIRGVAAQLVEHARRGDGVVAVLSAMGDTTSELLRLAHDVSPSPSQRELDLLVSTGERIACALCAMAVIDLGRPAVSLTGSMAGIVTDTEHGGAHILELRADRIRAALEEERIVLIAGFQGVSTQSEVTTLERGSALATATALAAELGAERHELSAGDLPRLPSP